METYELNFNVEYNYDGNSTNKPCEANLTVSYKKDFPFAWYIREFSECIPIGFWEKRFSCAWELPSFREDCKISKKDKYKIEEYRYTLYLRGKNWGKLEEDMKKTIENIIKLISKKFNKTDVLLNTIPKPIVIKTTFNSTGAYEKEE